MKKKLDECLNRIFKTPYFLELSQILVVTICNVTTSIGMLVRIELYRRILQAIFSVDGYSLLWKLFLLLVYEIIYCGMISVSQYQYAKINGNILSQLIDKILTKNEVLRALGNCQIGVNDRFTIASEDCSRYVASIMSKASLFADLVIVPCYIIYGCSINIIITVIITIIAVVLSVINRKNKKKLYGFNQEYSERYGYWSNFLWKAVDNLEVIKVFLDKKKIRTEQIRRNDSLNDIQQRQLKTYLDMTLIEESSDIVFTLFILCAAFFAMAKKIIMASDILAMVESLNTVQKVVFSLPEKLVQLNEMESLASRISQLEELEEEHSKVYTVEEFNKLTLKQLSFSYENKKVLKSIDFEFYKGKFYILVGKSGCGKSTLLKVLAKLIPYTGCIYWNEFELNEIGREVLYTKLVYQEQKQAFLEDTIKENICLSSNNGRILYEQILEKCFINQIFEKNNFDDTQVLSFRGAPLSSGERQMVSMASILYDQREVLLLDEVFSAIDPAKELVFFKELASLAKVGKTIILVSHRLINLEMADKILFMEDGQICETGNYRDLISKKGRFYEWYSLARKDETND